MQSILTQAGYQYDREQKVWRRDGFDGGPHDEMASRVMRILSAAGDVTSSSPELFQQGVVDASVRYHLSPSRSNLLRPFDQLFSGRILEIGPGSGAMTRFLGEVGGEVVAIESSRCWALVAAARCCDLANVHVVADDLSHLNFNSIFDVILLNGLSGALEEAAGLEGTLLSRLSPLLTPRGIIVVAATNRLSVRNIVETESASVSGFGRRKLQGDLARSGFPVQHWMFPLPGFELTTTLATADAFDHPTLWIPGLQHYLQADSDRYLAPDRRMAVEDIRRTTISNGLGPDLADSFLVFASRTEFSRPAGPGLACHFTVDRKPEYARRITLSIDSRKVLSVRNCQLFPELKPDPLYPLEVVPELHAELGESTQLTHDRLWSEELRSIVSTPEWSQDDVVRWARRWFVALLKRVPDQKTPPTASDLIPGHFLESLPEKMALTPDGEAYFINQDLATRYPIELGYLLFRGLFLTLRRTGKVAQPAEGTPLLLIRLLEQTARSLGIVLSDPDLSRYGRFESEVESWIYGQAFYNPEELAHLSLQVVAPEREDISGEARLSAAIEWCHQLKLENNELYAKLCESRAQLRRLQNDQASLWEWAVQLNTHPIRYALKKRAYNLARDTIRSLPIPVSLKRRLRDLYFSYIRPLLHRSEGKQGAAGRKDIGLDIARQSAVRTKRDVLIFSVIDWRFRVQRPQHIARSLADSGWRVFYFSKHFVNASEPGYEIEPISGADSLYRVKLHVKGSPSIYYEPPTETELGMLEASMERLRADLGVQSSVSLIQHPYWYPLVRRLPNSFQVYDCMDHHEGFGDVSEQLVALEKEMFAAVDLVTVTSQWLDEYARKYNQKVLLIRNAVEYEHFATRPERVYADAAGRRIIGYYGAIAEWFDVDLIRAAAMAYPQCLVLLVGEDSVGARRRLADLPNVKFIGEVPYSTLPYYLYAFDVCLLPFRIIPLTLATNPVKIYEYLASGRPVVCVDLPETGQFGDLVARASSASEFTAQIGVALRESFAEAEQNAARRRQFASEQTWRHRAVSLEKSFPVEQVEDGGRRSAR